ncbi:ABC transporter substrate-binding protein [Ruixingdingia sedimenti]|uniref:ABC transporter substrate-binding protein n=1 Tax=Ruixingdingia sedimenti TaxID=3073604 RepID=A0ABU1F915_9RHOB|nr:ABC transporter substrate-binding protein [Xinfangfangia sp. LG-4]MDR5653361.1 ABC transporter substrate-binding protein [Xinfangfangia sp. LG-4]
MRRIPGFLWRALAGAAAGVALAAPLPALAADPIVVGAPIPITGPFASDGLAMQQGLELAVEQKNAAGGLLGRPLELKVFDIGDLTPDKLEAAGVNLVQRQGASVLINGYGGMGPDIPAFCAYPVPYINNNATSNVIPLRNQMECGNIFMGSDVDIAYARQVFAQVGALLPEGHPRTIAIIHGPYDWELNVAEGMRESAAAAGWEVVMDAEVPYDNRQWQGILADVKRAAPGLVVFELLDTAGTSTFIDQFLLDPAPGAYLYAGYIFSTPAFQEVVARGGADGVIGMTVSSQLPGERGDAFVAAWQARYGSAPPFSIGAAIYDEFNLWAAAVEQVGNADDHAAINAAIRAMNYDGITGRYAFNDDHYVPVGDDTLPSHLIQASGGQIVTLMVGSQKQRDLAPAAR